MPSIGVRREATVSNKSFSADDAFRSGICRDSLCHSLPRQASMGNQFLETVRTLIESIASNPESFPVVYR